MHGGINKCGAEALKQTCRESKGRGCANIVITKLRTAFLLAIGLFASVTLAVLLLRNEKTFAGVGSRWNYERYDPINPTTPSIANDGQSIVYDSDRTGKSHVYATNRLRKFTA